MDTTYCLINIKLLKIPVWTTRIDNLVDASEVEPTIVQERHSFLPKRDTLIDWGNFHGSQDQDSEDEVTQEYPYAGYVADL